MLILLAALLGFLMDLWLGDPTWMPHPVILMGRAIQRLEAFLRPRFPATPRGEYWAGLVLALLLPVTTLLLSSILCHTARLVHPLLGLLLQTLWCWQALAMKGLAQESRMVYAQLERQDLPAARTAVARIVGRDTQALTEEGVTKAAVETVAENFADGVAAPLLCLFLGGAPLALCYKSINTMDSMLGYRNEAYLYFGRAAAKLDDLANYLPARLAALFWILAAGLTGHDGKNAYRIWRRDRRNHASPNSAQTEAACAGSLHIQLAGPAYYFGQRYDKPTIGDPDRPVEPRDILRANRILYAAGVLLLAVCTVLRLLSLVWS